MSLNFGAASSSVVFSIGNAANVSNGAMTFLALWKPTFVSGSNTGLLAGQSGASQRRSFLIDTSALFGDGDFTSGVAISGTAGDWLWVAMSKAAGSSVYRMHWRNFTTSGAWTHTSAAGAGTHTDPGVSNQINVGANAETAAASGDVAASAIVLANMADLAIEAACTAALADLMAASPAWAARFMNSAPSSIQDLTGGGGNETSRPGTVTNTADPAGFDFSLSGAVLLGQTPTSRHPGRGPSSVGRFYQTPQATQSISLQASSGGGDTSQHVSTASSATKNAAATGTAPTHPNTSGTATKKAAGTATASARSTVTGSGMKLAASGGTAITHPSTAGSARKQGAGTGGAQAHPVTQGATAVIPSGTGLAGAHPVTVGSGKHGAIGAGSSQARPMTVGVAKAGMAGIGRSSARATTAGAGSRSTTGAALIQTRSAVVGTGQEVEPFVPVHYGLDAHTTSGTTEGATKANATAGHTTSRGHLE